MACFSPSLMSMIRKNGDRHFSELHSDCKKLLGDEGEVVETGKQHPCPFHVRNSQTWYSSERDGLQSWVNQNSKKNKASGLNSTASGSKGSQGQDSEKK